MLTYWQHHPSLSYLFSGRFVGPTSQAPRVDEGRPETLYELEIAFSEIERLAAAGDSEHRPWVVDRALRHLLTDITGNTHRAEFCIDKLYSPDSLRGRLGLLELRGFEMTPHPDMALVQALLVRALVARFAEQPYSAPLVRWGTAAARALPAAALRAGRPGRRGRRPAGPRPRRRPGLVRPVTEFRFPRIGVTTVGEVGLELRSAIEPWYVLGEESTSGAPRATSTPRSSGCRCGSPASTPARHAVTCNGRPVPLTATGTPGQYVAGVRYRAWKPWSALHPTLEIDSPLVFDVVDRAAAVSLGGATYHVVHPGGRSYDVPPVNAKEAEARRAARFEAVGHTTGVVDIDALDDRPGLARPPRPTTTR